MRKPNKYLLDRPSSKWRKEEWLAAAKILADDTQPTGIIDAVMHQAYKDEVATRVNAQGKRGSSKRRRGRPVRVKDPHRLLVLVEQVKKRLADEKGVDQTDIKDVEVANSFAAKAMGRAGGKGYVAPELIARYQNAIKYVRYKTKPRQ
jgi:hypothetical protein